MPNSLFLVRHGQTSWSKEGLFCGVTDVSLNQIGIAQSKAVSIRLRALANAKYYSSPLVRASKFAALSGVKTELRSEISEMDLGLLEGLNSVQYRSEHPSWSLFHDGAPEGEALSSFSLRLRGMLETIGEDLFLRDVVVFSHGQAIKGMLSILLTGNLSIADSFSVSEASVTELALTLEHKYRLVLS
jgi:probable phosphoglycerate mutase